MLGDVLEDVRLARRPTTAYIDLAALRANVDHIRSIVGGRKIMAIVKANAYGHGLVPTASALLRFGVDALGVAFLEEGIALRRSGITSPILVLGGLIGNQIQHFIEYNLQITAASPYKVRQINAAATALGTRAKVHLKFDTGLERLGVHWDNSHLLIDEAVNAPYIEVCGAFSHLAQSGSVDPHFTELQLRRFQSIVSQLERLRRQSPNLMVHLANSGGILYHPDTWFDMVRPGLALYGYSPRAHDKTTLKPVLKLATRVVYFKVVRAGASVGYGGTWKAKRDTRVVTLPVGYGDGYDRALSNKAEVIIRGIRYPVVGLVSMDAMTIDIGSGGTAYNGDEVILIGASENGSIEITADELADWAGTIAYEVLSSINTRVPRVYINQDVCSQ